MRFEDQPGREGPNDRRETGARREPRENEAQDEPRGEEHSGHAHARSRAQETRRHPDPRHDRHREKNQGLRGDIQDFAAGKGRSLIHGGDDPGQRGQDHETQHVVQHGRAEDDPRLEGMPVAQIS